MELSKLASYIHVDPSKLMKAQGLVEKALVMFDRDDELVESYLKDHLAGDSLKYAMDLISEASMSYMGTKVEFNGKTYSAPTLAIYNVASKPELKSKIKEKVSKRNEQQKEMRKEEVENLTEEQVWEEVETWVNSLLEEGYDLSDYTWDEMYEFYLDEAITSEKGKAKAAEMIAARSTPSGRAKSGKGANVAQIRKIGRSNREGLGGTPMTPTMAKNPVKKKNYDGSGNRAARRAGLTPTREKPNAWKEEVENLTEREMDEPGERDDNPSVKAHNRSLRNKSGKRMYPSGRAGYGRRPDISKDPRYGSVSEKLDPVGGEDADVDNDGKKNDKNDKYIKNRRAAIAKAMSTRKEEVELDELYKGKHGQSEKEYQDNRSDAGKRISGDSQTGPNYYTKGRSRGAKPDAPTSPGAKPVNTPKLSSSEKEYHQYNKSGAKNRAQYNKVGGSKGLPGSKNEEFEMDMEMLEQYHLLRQYFLESEIAFNDDEVLEIFENISDEDFDYFLNEAETLIKLVGKRKGEVVLNPKVKGLGGINEQAPTQPQMVAKKKEMPQAPVTQTAQLQQAKPSMQQTPQQQQQLRNQSQMQQKQQQLQKQKMQMKRQGKLSMSAESYDLQEVDLSTQGPDFSNQIVNAQPKSTKKGKSLSDFKMVAKNKKQAEEYVAEEDPCWKGYTQVGMKKKGGREVPNCVPSKGVPKAKGYKEEVEQIDEISTRLAGKVVNARIEKTGAAADRENKARTPQNVRATVAAADKEARARKLAAGVRARRAANEEFEIEEGKQSFPFKKVEKQMAKARAGSVYGKPASKDPVPNVSDSEKKETTRFSKMHHASEKAKREKQNADKARRSPTFYKDTHPASAPKMKKANEEVENIEEKAPPGDKYERMVKHIKKGYSKDGLTKKEKGIAYATAWKAYNK